MSRRGWLVLIVCIVLVGGAATWYWLPELIRQVAVARIHAMTGRPVSIEAVRLNLLTGRFTIRDFRLAEREGTAPFADFAQLDIRVYLPSLLRGHLWIRELVLRDSTVRVVRVAGDEFNFSDLIQTSGATSKALDVTVDRFALTGGTVTLEDRALPEWRTWASEHITIEAHNLSTLRGDGRAVGRSVTAGAPVAVEVNNLRLYPIHLRATVRVEGLDLSMARVYFPPSAPVIVDRGRASTSVTVALDARDGLRVDADGQFEDVAFVKADEDTPLALVPKLTAQVTGFGVREGDLQLEQLAVEGTMDVREPTAKGEARFRPSRVQASIADLTWPARTAGRLDLRASIPGGGMLTAAGTVRPPPEATQLHVRVADLDLAPWAQFLPLAVRARGLAEADLRMNEPLAAGIPARVQGAIAVNGLGVADARQELVSVERIEAGELELHWPTQLVVGRILVSGPRGIVERDHSGRFPLRELAGRPGASPAVPSAPAADSQAETTPPFGVEIDEVVVRDGAVAWRDATVSPPARFDVSGIEATALRSSLRGSLSVPYITIEAHNLSTLRNDGGAAGHSVTAGAPVSVEVTNLRLDPIHLLATARVQGLDLSVASVYLPPSAPVIVNRGRASTSVTMALDARDGLRIDADGQFEDVAFIKTDESTPLALVPNMTAQVTGFGFREGALQLERLAVEGTINVRDPAAKEAASYRASSVQASIADLTWPARTAGRLDIQASIPGGGMLTGAGTVRPPPDATQLHVRVVDLDLAPWAQFLPLAGKVRGLAEADLRMNEPLAAGIPAQMQGTIAVKGLGVADARQELISVERIEASGLEVHWPSRFVVGRILVSRPHGIVERDRSGHFPLTTLAGRPGASDAKPAQAGADSAAVPPFGVEVDEVVVRDGTLAWDDATVLPPARLGATSIEATVSALSWPQPRPLNVRIGLRPPGGGHVELAGRVGLDPITADLRVIAKDAELAPYQPYVPIPARISGAADLDLAVVLPPLTERRATARGSLALSRVDVRDEERTVARLQRAGVKGLAVEWPDRITVNRLELAQPWVLVERDQNGALPLPALFTPGSDTTHRSGTAATAPAASPQTGSRDPLAVTVAELALDDGGIRVVDRTVSPAFAVDFQSATLRMESISTASASPARVDLAGRIGAAELALRGTIGLFRGPLRLDMSGELREFSIPRTNPYLVRQVGWRTRDGRLATKIRCRIDGDALSAHTDFRLSRLELEQAGDRDEAQARIGLPLGLMTGLMKDSRGDINLSFPVGGRLSDPRFDFREAIWGAIRTVSINAITLPVSWIGRIHVGGDSRIQQIEVDPIPFESGTARLTPEGHTRVAAVTAFLQQLPAMKLALTPLISSDDVGQLRRQLLEATIDDLARAGRLSRQDAVTRLFVQRLPDQPVPGTPEATFEALLAREPRPTSEAVAELAARRVEAVRAPGKQAGIDAARLVETKVVAREDGGSRIDLEVLDPETPQLSKVREILRRLGVPLKGSDARE
ncbi:MAG TPA: DUF748 domain-containing protein [Actinomycetota bacterium]|nr:DUF748 domain-containing protein [Actinomycetota bacterium]